jgi:4-amino-4-deoxy-L-arabinose transferase-like glycosyltransferase
LVVILIVAVAGLRLTYLAGSCPLDLAPDEAHYWDWSRHLDWSYYSKGPLVAYLIRLGTSGFGPWSDEFLANDMLAVRLPAVLCGSLLLVCLYILTYQTYGEDRLAFALVAMALTLPMISAASTIMTIDAPYTCCWGVALVLGHQAIFRGSRWAWPAAGLAVGLGILAKYTMVIWLPSVFLFLMTSRCQRPWLWRPGFWVMTAVAGGCCLPILFWNWQHDWVTFRHVGGQAGLTDEQSIHMFGPFAYCGTQFGLLLGFWFVVWLLAMIAHRPWVETDPGLDYLWWMSAPMFGLFLAFSFKTNGGEPNWPVTTYESGLVLAAGWLARQLKSPVAWYRRWTVVNIMLFCGLGAALTVVMHHTEWLHPLLARVAGPAAPVDTFALRRFDPTCRLRGWQTLARAVDRLRGELRQEGIDPILAGTGWALPGELGFYCDGHPAVYSLGLALGDRHSQYDFWRPNPLDDPAQFAGRTFIIIGPWPIDYSQAFDRVDPPHLITHFEQARPLAAFSATVCRGFHGFPSLPRPISF